MDAIFTNLGDAPIPLGSTKSGGFLDPINPDEPYTVTGAGYTVVTAGDNPSFREELAEAFKNILAVFERIITFWREHEGKDFRGDPVDVVVRLRIHNRGPNDLRVILGNNTNDTVLVAGNTADFSAPDYIEVRELGV